MAHVAFIGTYPDNGSMTKSNFAIRAFRAEDYPQIQDIYEQGLVTGNASYEHRPLTLEEFIDGKNMDTVFVAVELHDESKVIGWVSGAPISQRPVLAGVLEDSIYVDPEAHGRRVASGLLDKFIEVCQELGMWAIHSWIFPENEGSVKLHVSRGFEEVGTYKHLAKMTYGPRAGEWRDTVVYQKLLPKPEKVTAEEEFEATASERIKAQRPLQA